MLSLVFALDYWEGAEDVVCVVFGDAVEDEVERVESGAKVHSLVVVPDEGIAVVSDVACEVLDVVCGVCEF